MSDYDGEDASGFGSNGFQMMGMMNALKTGDVQTDMMIAMCLPFVLKMLFGYFSKIEDLFDYEAWAKWWEGKSSDHERFIAHNTTRNCWGNVTNMDEDTQNSVLLKSIKMYLHQVVKLKLKTANLDLTGMEDKSSNDCYDTDSDDEDDEEHGSRRTLVGTLSRYKIINRLPNNEWHELGEHSNGTSPPSMVKLRIEHESHKEGDGKEKENSRSLEVNNTTFHFTSPGEGAIDAFIDTAYRWYIGELRKLEGNSRYLYEMKPPEIRIGGNNNNDDDDSSGGTTYKRYKLSEDKSFESLFFREKESLLGLIDHFSAKSGKYAITGYPHKLGVMLYGPPGTGKTSLIKALAQYTGRSIVNVPLSRVSTNSELMSIFFDRKYHIEGAYVPVKLSFKDVIFVMEDVDAASKIVKRRDGRTSAQVIEPEKIDLPIPKSLWRMFLESTHDDCSALVKELVVKSERLKKEAEAMKPEVLCAIAQRVTGLPALGLISEGAEDPAIAQICEQAMESANAQNSQYSKLDDILSSHAQAIKALIESGSEVEENFVEELLGETGALTRSFPTTIPTSPGASSSSDFNESVALERLDVASLGSEAEKLPKGKGVGFGPCLFKPNPDQLSLSGLLNVLDGVVDTPGRIMIMTTNHPEMLDPALIRPGRVDKKIMLGYMASADIICMLEHYFQTTLSNTLVARVEDIVNGDDGDPKFRVKFTPAQVEQLASEHDSLEDMFDAMERVGRSLRPCKRAKYVTKAHSWEVDRR